MSDIDDILDGTLEDLADLPEFKVPPAGAYLLKILGGEVKKVNDVPSVEFKFKVIETKELVDESEEPVADGTETSLLFMLNNEFGEGAFKKFLQPLSNHFGTSSKRELVEGAKGLEIVATVSVRKGKKDADRKYFNIVDFLVV